MHQWSKNLLIFVPLFVGHAYHDLTSVFAAAEGFALLCVLASATYMVNDIADLDADRRHQVKRRRPFASGELPVAFGLTVAPLLIVAALAGAFFLSPAFAATLTLYLVLTLAYSFSLKQLPLLDVFIIGMLFVLRIVMGTAVLGLGYSPWLLTFSWAFFLSLALAKRHVEVVRAERQCGTVALRQRGAGAGQECRRRHRVRRFRHAAPGLDLVIRRRQCAAR